jgi:hypothetical protein
MANEAKAKEVFSDKAFVASLLKLETPEAAQTALKAKGFDLSLDELQAFRDTLLKAVESGGELNETELEKVAGGCGFPAAIPYMAVSAVAGTLIAAGGISVAVSHFTRIRW